MGDITQSAFSTKEPGVEAPVDTGAAGMTTHTNPSFGDRLGSMAGSYIRQQSPVGGMLYDQIFNAGKPQQPPQQGGLSDQVFNTGQAQQPLPDGVGPAIVGINKGNVDPEQAHGGGLGMKLIKALMMG